jgi:hypothetical protein
MNEEVKLDESDDRSELELNEANQDPLTDTEKNPKHLLLQIQEEDDEKGEVNLSSQLEYHKGSEDE